MQRSGGKRVSSNLTVSNAVLNSVSMTPSNSKLPLGIIRQFHLIGNFSDGTTQDLSPWSQWFASEPLTVTEIFQGEVVGLSAGVGQIGAQFGSFSASTPVTVTNATLSSMSVTPASITLRQGQSQPLTATGKFSDGYSQNLLLNAVFTPGNRQIIQIGEDGIAFADGVGSTQITTTFQNQTVTTPVLVLSNTLSALTVTPSAPALDSGAQQQLTATGTYTDGTASDVSSWTTWTSSNPAVLNVDENGLLTAYPTTSPVTVTVTALSGGTSQSGDGHRLSRRHQLACAHPRHPDRHPHQQLARSWQRGTAPCPRQLLRRERPEPYVFGYLGQCKPRLGYHQQFRCGYRCGARA